MTDCAAVRRLRLGGLFMAPPDPLSGGPGSNGKLWVGN